MAKHEFTTYVHGGGKDGNSELWHELGLDETGTEDAYAKFLYTAYEIPLSCIVDDQTGKVTLVAVNGVDLVEPTCV